MKIKQIPEDFIVKETARLELDGGKFAYFLMRKRQWNTIDAVKEIAERMGIGENKVTYGGIKDRQAVTEQHIAIEGVSKDDAERLHIKDISLSYIGQGGEKMHTERLSGNEFVITIRDLQQEMKEPPKFIPNYFDEQRFGVKASNHLVGKALIKKEFGKACGLLGLKPEQNQFINMLVARKEILKLCFNAYQSYLFNEALAEYVRNHYKAIDADYSAGKLAFAELKSVKNFEIPLLHFDTEMEGEIKTIYEGIMKREGIRQSDFLLRQLPNLIQQSVPRLAFITVRDYKVVEFSDDELNEGRKKQVVNFKLPKGSYATIVIKAMSEAQPFRHYPEP